MLCSLWNILFLNTNTQKPANYCFFWNGSGLWRTVGTDSWCLPGVCIVSCFPVLENEEKNWNVLKTLELFNCAQYQWEVYSSQAIPVLWPLWPLAEWEEWRVKQRERGKENGNKGDRETAVWVGPTAGEDWKADKYYCNLVYRCLVEQNATILHCGMDSLTLWERGTKSGVHKHAAPQKNN